MQLSILDVLVKKTEICLDPYWENRCVSAQIPVRGRVTCLCCLLLMDIELGGRRWSVMTPDIADPASRDHRSSGYISGLRVGGYLNANKCLNVPSRFPTAHWLLSDFVYSVSPPCRGAVSARVMMINHRYWTRGAPLHRALPGAGGEGRRGGGTCTFRGRSRWIQTPACRGQTPALRNYNGLASHTLPILGVSVGKLSVRRFYNSCGEIL